MLLYHSLLLLLRKVRVREFRQRRESGKKKKEKEQTPTPERVEEKVDQVSDEFELTQEQKDEINEIISKAYDKERVVKFNRKKYRVTRDEGDTGYDITDVETGEAVDIITGEPGNYTANEEIRS